MRFPFVHTKIVYKISAKINTENILIIRSFPFASLRNLKENRLKKSLCSEFLYKSKEYKRQTQ